LDVHPLIERAARGELPSWAEATPERREHMSRVAGLMEEWAGGLRLSQAEQVRFRAAGFLHDTLRDAEPETLRHRVPPALQRLPERVLHGPAAAERLRNDGVADGELLLAVAYHTLGHCSFGLLGRALYLADFLEPGRDLLNDWRRALRSRMPGEVGAVLSTVLGARIAHLVERGGRLRPETVAFWNTLAQVD